MKQIRGLFLSKMTQVGTPIALISTIFLSSCGNIGDLTDKMLFGATLDDQKLQTCSSKITVTLTQIDLVEDGDGAYNSTGGNWGYFARQFCIYPNQAFTGGPLQLPVAVTGNRTSTDGDRVRFSLANSTTVNQLSMPSSLSFPAHGTANQQCFIVQRFNNGLDDADSPITISIGKPTVADSSGIYSDEDPCDIAVTVDDDEGPRIRVSNMSNATEEPYGPTYTNGVNGSFSVQLLNAPTNTPPSANVVIPLNALYDAKNGGYREGKLMTDNTCTTELTSLTFTPANWNIAQQVWVCAQPDYREDSDVQYILQLQNAQSADPNYNGKNPRDVTVINRNKDTIGYTYGGFGGSGNTTGATGATVTGFATDEMGNFGTSYSCFTVKLRSQPQSNVVLAVTNSIPAVASSSLNELTFTPANWDSTQQICMTGTTDGANSGNRDYDISFTVTTTDPGYNGSTAPTFRMRSCDNDASNQIIPCNFSGSNFGTSTSRLVTSENGTKAGLWLISKHDPGGTVTVGTASNDTSEGTTPASVSITSANYNKMQGGGSNYIEATGQDDALPDGAVNYEVITAESTGVLTVNPQDVYFRNNDNEALYTVSKSGNTAEDNSSTATITLRLNFDNTDTIQINITCTDSTECKEVNPTSVTFNAHESGGAFEKTITVYGEDDTYADGNKNFNVNFAIQPTTDATYSGQNPPSQSVTNVDNEPAAKAIFVTTNTYNGEFGGATGINNVDAACEAEKTGKPAGTYKALIVGEGSDVGDGVPPVRRATTDGATNAGQTNWVLQAGLYYYLWTNSGSNDENARLFIANGHGLIAFPMGRGFSTNGADRFWTGMNSNMTTATIMGGEMATPNCNAWTYAQHPVSPNPDFWGNYGAGNSTASSAVSSGNIECTNSYKLICVQQ